MATSFLGFARLPYELRHTIWEETLPSEDFKPMRFFIKCLAHLILSQPRDTFFGHGVPSKYDGTIIYDFMRSNPSPYAGLDTCPESRVVAFKHINQLLRSQKDLESWLVNPKFPYTDPALVIHERQGKLFYRCEKISNGFDLEKFAFWEFKPDIKPRSRPLPSSATNEEHEKWMEARDLKATEKLEEGNQTEGGNIEEFFWDADYKRRNTEGEETLPWDDESDAENNDVLLQVPDNVTQTDNIEIEIHISYSSGMTRIRTKHSTKYQSRN